ncbi:MAG TPA: alpha/beta hydrolase [Candidatus Saccharimonadales bacterium]
MAQKTPQSPADYISPLSINGLEGRMLHMPAPAKRNREILIVYGHHAMIERWWGLLQNYNEYGAVTMPDLPGFGGMDSFYKIGRRPDIDAFADYLAAFIKLRYKRKRITIVGISFGFLVATRMLQKYPELTKKVDIIISIVGFMHKDDFVYPPRRRRFFSRATRVFATRPFAIFIRRCCLNSFVLKTLYTKLPNSKRRMIEVTEEQFAANMDFEVQIWQANDVRTHWLTTSEFLEIDNCTKKINLPIHHVVSEQDHYFNNEIVKQHMLVVFNNYHSYTARSKAHTPSILADKKEMSVLLPTGLKRVLGRR